MTICIDCGLEFEAAPNIPKDVTRCAQCYHLMVNALGESVVCVGCGFVQRVLPEVIARIKIPASRFLCRRCLSTRPSCPVCGFKAVEVGSPCPRCTRRTSERRAARRDEAQFDAARRKAEC